MAIKDYDIMVDIVENNIMLDKDTISGKVSSVLGLTERKAGELFQNIHPEGRTLKQYIVDRKNLRALGECASGTTKEAACERYNIDPVNFYKSIKYLFPDKQLADFRKEGFTCPKPITLTDIIKYEGVQVKKEQLKKDEERIYIEEIQRLIDENSNLKNDLETERKKSLKRNDGLTEEMIITVDTYRRFLEIEDKRIIYGFSVSEILKLYKESLRSKHSLDELCNKAQDSYYFELERNSHKESYHYNLEDEMDSGEVWDYFFEDDDPVDLPSDPYAPTEEDKYFDKLMFEEEYGTEDEYYEDDISEEQEKQIEKIMEQLDQGRSHPERATENQKKHKETNTIEDEDIPF